VAGSGHNAGLARLSVDELLDELLVRVRELMSGDTPAVLLLAVCSTCSSDGCSG
jgi:hypothetical protein